MPTTSEQIVNAQLRHSIGTRRAGNEVAIHEAGEIQTLNALLLTSLGTLIREDEPLRPDSNKVPGVLQKMQDDARAGYDKAIANLRERVQRGQATELRFLDRSTELIDEGALRQDAADPFRNSQEVAQRRRIDQRAIDDVVAVTLFQGLLMIDWARDIEAKHLKGIAEAITEALTLELTIGGLIDHVATHPKVMRIISDAATWARTVFHGSASATQSIFWGSMEDKIRGMIWVSTLDMNTTKHWCLPRAGLFWERQGDILVPMGHDLEWGLGPGHVHYNCRAFQSPVFVGEEVPNTETGDVWLGNLDADELVEYYGPTRARFFTRTGRAADLVRDDNTLFSVDELDSFDDRIFQLLSRAA